MLNHDPSATLSEIGEKSLIEEMLRPLFNPTNELNSVGDDCAALEATSGWLTLISTDRVPADLISFRAGVLGFRALGRYLGALNLSDVAACGGIPQGLLLNCGLPANMLVKDILAIATGFNDIARQFETKVIGGDVTSSSELSLSATVVGQVESGRILRRSGARRGDSVFISREIGLTPVALQYCLRRELFGWLTRDQRELLEAQFTSITPEIDLGRQLAFSGDCTSCMDNTDGIAQSLTELARESRIGIIIREDQLGLSALVDLASRYLDKERTSLALGSGADFGLVGTLRGSWTTESASQRFGRSMRVVGEIVDGQGLYLDREGQRVALKIPGWNYFI